MTEFFRRKYFSKGDKLIAFIGVLFLFWMLVIPTNRFIHPLALSISSGEMQFTRTVPFGEVRASWWIEMSVKSYECYDAKMSPLTSYQDNPEFPGEPWTVSYDTPRYLENCIDLVEALPVSQHFILEQSHQVWLLGWFPLRAMHTKWICQDRGLDCDIAERGGGIVEWFFKG